MSVRPTDNVLNQFSLFFLVEHLASKAPKEIIIIIIKKKLSKTFFSRKQVMIFTEKSRTQLMSTPV